MSLLTGSCLHPLRLDLNVLQAVGFQGGATSNAQIDSDPSRHRLQAGIRLECLCKGGKFKWIYSAEPIHLSSHCLVMLARLSGSALALE